MRTTASTSSWQTTPLQAGRYRTEVARSGVATAAAATPRLGDAFRVPATARGGARQERRDHAGAGGREDSVYWSTTHQAAAVVAAAAAAQCLDDSSNFWWQHQW